MGYHYSVEDARGATYDCADFDMAVAVLVHLAESGREGCAVVFDDRGLSYAEAQLVEVAALTRSA